MKAGTQAACDVQPVEFGNFHLRHRKVEEKQVDIIGCLGNFSMLAMLLNTFQVDLKPDDEPPFPDVRGFAKVSTEEA